MICIDGTVSDLKARPVYNSDIARTAFVRDMLPEMLCQLTKLDAKEIIFKRGVYFERHDITRNINLLEGHRRFLPRLLTHPQHSNLQEEAQSVSCNASILECQKIWHKLELARGSPWRAGGILYEGLHPWHRASSCCTSS